MKLIIALQLSSALFALTTFAGWAQAVNPVVVKGQEFVDTKTNNRVQIIGVEYVGARVGQETWTCRADWGMLVTNLVDKQAITQKSKRMPCQMAQCA
jgi:hypothetical protein